MKKTNIIVSVAVWLVTALFVAAAFGIFAWLVTCFSPEIGINIISSIALFTLTPLFGIIGLEVSLMLIRKKFVALGRRSLVKSIAATLAFGIVIGFASQLVYAMGTVTSTTTIELPGEVERLNIVLAMDKSDSMYNAYFSEPCAEAACTLVDGLSDDFYMKYISFSADVIGETDLLKMTDGNKENVKSQIERWEPSGGTNFDEPIKAALNAVDGVDGTSVIILVTDGRAELSATLASKLSSKNDDLSFYVLYISEDAQPDIVGIADESFEIPQNEEGGIDVSKVLAALRSAVKTTTREKEETEEVFGITDDALTYPVDVERVNQVMITFAAFVIYAVFVSWLYFGSVSDIRAIINIAVGVVVWALTYFLAFIAGGEGLWSLGALIFFAVLSVPYVSFDVRED